MEELLSPREASRILGVSPERIRQFEKNGLLNAVKTPGGHRRYDRKDVEGLRDRKNNALR